jgi:hypothetical protein
VSAAVNRPLGDQRDPEQRGDRLLPQDRVEDVRVVDLLDDHRSALRRDAPGEALAERDANALPDLLLEPAGRGRHEVGRCGVEEQDGGGVGAEEGAHAVQQFVEQFGDVEVGELRIGHELDPAESVLVRGARQGHARQSTQT